MKFLLLFLILGVGIPGFARLASNDEVPLLVRKLERETVVKGDGTFTDRWNWRIKVQRREAREDAGTRSIRFYKSFEEVKVLRAGTRTEGSFKEISLKDLQERAVTDENPGFSSLHEYVLSFPDVQEGSEIEFEYEIRARRALEPDFWGQSFEVDTGSYEAFAWTIRSAKPLRDFLRDPTGRLETFKEAASAAGYKLTFRSKGPFGLSMADEVDPYLSNQRKIVMMASFLTDWSAYGRHSANEFEARVGGSLTKDDEAFALALKADPDPARRIQRILQRISTKLRYFGDWRATEQMYVPRTLAEISRTLYGDCKDFALLAVKMLRTAGLEAQPAWILNTEDPPAADLYLFPTDNAFNHVIVRASMGDTHWWVDPTNPAARVNYLADEIAGRPALLFGKDENRLLPIRPIRSADYRTEMTSEISRAGRHVNVSLKTLYAGFAPVSAGERMKRDGAAYYVDEHAQRLMPAASLSEVTLEKLDADRETGDLRSYQARARFEDFWVRTSAGLGFSPVREDVIERLRTLRLTDRGGDVFLGKVYVYRESLLLKGFRRQGPLKLDCEVKSPWMDFSQKVVDDGRGVRFESSFDLKEPVMVLTEEARPRALLLQRQLRECAGRVLLLLR